MIATQSRCMNYLDKTAFQFASVFITPSFGPKYARFGQDM